MKKLINTAFLYAILAMAGGVFYREFTKFNGFEGRTTLSFLHVHLFMLGMLFFLVCTVLEHNFSVREQKPFPIFFILYNIGLPLTVVMLLVRGILQVLNTPLSAGINGMISGVSGLGHILLGISIILFFVSLRRAVARKVQA